jgi:hypothetical protein
VQTHVYTHTHTHTHTHTLELVLKSFRTKTPDPGGPNKLGLTAHSQTVN